MVYMLLGTGFEETEAIAPLDLLRRAGIPVLTVGINGKTVYGGHNIGIEADITVGEMDLTAMEMIVLPGGLGGVASIRASKEAMDALRFAWNNGKYIAAICAAPSIFGHRGMLDGRNACSYPSFEEQLAGATVSRNPVEVSEHVITSRGMGTAIDFALCIVSCISGQQCADEI